MKWLSLGLVLSLLINFVALGYIATRAVHQSVIQELAAEDAPPFPDAFVQSYAQALKAQWRELLPLLVKLRRARAVQRELLAAPEFDKVAFVQAQARLRDAQFAFIAALQNALPEALEHLPAEVRQSLPPLHRRWDQVTPPLLRREGGLPPP